MHYIHAYIRLGVTIMRYKHSPQTCDHKNRTGKSTLLFTTLQVLENRTKASMAEMEMIETLEELKEMNSRHAKVDFESMIQKHKAYEEQLAKLQDEQDEAFVK